MEIVGSVIVGIKELEAWLKSNGLSRKKIGVMLGLSEKSARISVDNWFKIKRIPKWHQANLRKIIDDGNPSSSPRLRDESNPSLKLLSIWLGPDAERFAAAVLDSGQNPCEWLANAVRAKLANGGKKYLQ